MPLLDRNLKLLGHRGRPVGSEIKMQRASSHTQLYNNMLLDPPLTIQLIHGSIKN
jgi:hypothetical protein